MAVKNGLTQGRSDGNRSQWRRPIPNKTGLEAKIHPRKTTRKLIIITCKLCSLSDTYGLHHRLSLPPDGGDVLIHCGDFADRGSKADILSFRDWLQAQTNFGERIVVAGNHDRDLSQPDAINLEAEFARKTSEEAAPIQFLQDEFDSCANGRLLIFGASWRTCEEDSYESIDLNHNGGKIDLLLSHIPPFWPSASRERLGSLSLAHGVPESDSHYLWWALALGPLCSSVQR